MAITALKPLGKPAQEPETAKKGLTPLTRIITAPESEVINVTSEVVDTVTAPAVVTETTTLAISEPAPSFSLGETVGHIEASDFHRPRLELSQSVGPLMELGFPPGQVVIAQEEALWADGYPALEVTFLAGQKRFVEDVPYGSDQKARYFDLPEQVKAAGLWTTWQNDEKPPVYPQLTYVALIKKPDHAQSAQFGIEFGDALYALAEVKYAKTAYPEMSKILLSPSYRGKLHTAKFAYTCTREKKGKNTVTLPKAKFVGWHEPAFVEFIKGLV